MKYITTTGATVTAKNRAAADALVIEYDMGEIVSTSRNSAGIRRNLTFGLWNEIGKSWSVVDAQFDDACKAAAESPKSCPIPTMLVYPSGDAINEAEATAVYDAIVDLRAYGE